MEIFIAEQCKTLAESLIMGLIFGAGYDIIRILYVLWGIQSYSVSGKLKKTADGNYSFWLFLTGDLLYMLFLTIAVSVFLYHTNHGQLRLYLVCGALAGFVLYQNTIGRVVMVISETIVHILKITVGFLLIRPLGWFGRKVTDMMKCFFRIITSFFRKHIRRMILELKRRRCVRRFPVFVRL